MALMNLMSGLSFIWLAIPLGCATSHPSESTRTAQSARTDTAEGPLIVEMPVTRVEVPTHPDSAWAVATAARMLAGTDTTQHFELVRLCSVTAGYLVDLKPTVLPHLSGKPAILQLGGGGLVFISLYGEAVIVIAYQ